MIKTQLILLLSLFSPLAEAFPNLYMSWWTPSNGKLQKYLDTWLLRLIIVILVWLPILIILAKITENFAFILLIGILVFLAFGFRLYFFNRSLGQELKRGVPVETSKIPEFFYLLVFFSIGVVLHMNVPSNRWLVLVAILLIFIGAGMISTFRKGKFKSLTFDVIGRLVFIAGFLLNLYNLVGATSGIV